MRAKRNKAWKTIIVEAFKPTLSKVGLRSLRMACEDLGLSGEDMEDIESALGYRSEDLAVLYGKWASVRKFREAKKK